MTSYDQNWKNAGKNWSYYWGRYGGAQSLVRSPYFAIALALTIVSISYGSTKNWVDASFQIIPSLLGFSIAGFAVLLVFSSDRFLKIISEGGIEDSLFLTASVTFVHFIVVQVVSIVMALLALAEVPVAHTAAIFGLFYSVMTALASCFVLFDIAQVYNRASGVDHDKMPKKSGDDHDGTDDRQPTRRQA